jgi:hypothetical protein
MAAIVVAGWLVDLEHYPFTIGVEATVDAAEFGHHRVAAAIGVVEIEQIWIIRMESQPEQALLPVSGADPIGQVEGHSDTDGMDNTSPLHCQ